MIFAIIASWVAKKSEIDATTKPKRALMLAPLRTTYDHNIYFGTFFN